MQEKIWPYFAAAALLVAAHLYSGKQDIMRVGIAIAGLVVGLILIRSVASAIRADLAMVIEEETRDLRDEIGALKRAVASLREDISRN